MWLPVCWEMLLELIHPPPISSSSPQPNQLAVFFRDQASPTSPQEEAGEDKEDTGQPPTDSIHSCPQSQHITKLFQRHNPQTMASGVKVDAGCKQAYDDLHNKHLHSFLIFRISDDDTTIIVEKKGEKNAPYTEFVEEMKKLVGDGKQCRYAAVDVHVEVQRQGTEGMSRLSKVIFVQYCPDEAPVRRRMLYASSVRALKATLGLESLLQIQASELSDIDEKAIKHEVMSSQRI